MVDAWVAGAVNLVDERRAVGNRVGADYRVPLSAAPWRKLFHTMEAPEDDPGTVPDEGWSLEQTRNYIIHHEFPPHLWALHHHGVVFQTVPLTKAAYALKHDWTGYPETNHVHVIQTEVMGFARNGLNGELADWLGHRVLGPVLDAGVPVDLSNLAPTDDDSASGINGSVRFSAQRWYAFDGICGHQNVPRNSHWDPGHSDYARIARAAGHGPTPPKPPEIEEDDSMVIIRNGNQARYVTGRTVVVCTGETNVQNARDAGVPVFYVENDEWARFHKAPFVLVG